MQVVVEPQTVPLTSTNFIYSVPITNNHDIPKDHDIVKTLFEFPDNLDHIRLIIGGQLIAIFDKTRYNNLEVFPIYRSLLQYYNTYFELVYDKKWLYENETTEDQDEYREVETFGPETIVYDNGDYFTGSLVTRHREPTGNKVRTIVKPVSVEIPKIVFVLEKHKVGEAVVKTDDTCHAGAHVSSCSTVHPNLCQDEHTLADPSIYDFSNRVLKVFKSPDAKYIDVPVLQKFKLSTMSDEDKKKYMETRKYNIDGDYVYFQNYCRYQEGYGGLTHCVTAQK